ncbi:MAG: ISNCY family transposase [Nitrosopumilaceae archaeon]
MRKVMEMQLSFGEIDISNIKFDLRSRDEIPKLLMGLQYLYCNKNIRDEVFAILESMVPKKINSKNGRPGMELWKILVLGTLRLNCDWDYDKLQEMANNHMTLRQMLGHGDIDKDYKYAIQTLKDNIKLFTPEILNRINRIVVKTGHTLVKKKEETIKVKVDSFVVKTNVHYPTDITLLLDAIRKVITLIVQLYTEPGLPGWRQSAYNFRSIKNLSRRIQKLKRSNSKNEKKKEQRDKLIIEAYLAYLERVEINLKKAKENIRVLNDDRPTTIIKVMEIEKYIKHAEKQIEQIKKRVLKSEKIPHDEKIFSIFEEYTEWISKGKAGVPQELGLRVCIVEDNHGFILNHQVMQKKTDDKVAVSIIQETKEKFPELNSCSFDKGFYTPDNREKLLELLDNVILPRKGRLSQIDKEIEYSEEFIKGRRKHSAVESGINALEQHGLDMCPDHGIAGFKRYVALSVLSRNIQILGNIIQQKKLKQQKRREKLWLARKLKLYNIAA